MKKILVYLSVFAAIIAAGCTDFGDENQLTLPAAPEALITGVTPASTTVSFKVAPSGEVAYYSWLVVESATPDETLQATNILRQTATGLVKGIANYAKTTDSIVVVEELKPFTVYQIYAVASSKDGVVSAVKNATFRTLDDGGKPTPQKVALKDSVVTLEFHEPLRLGTGKVYVSYFAKNTLSGTKPFVIAPGTESFNPQDIVIDASELSVNGNSLVIKLPEPPAGAYASITYDAGAVLDIEGNGSNAFILKADTLDKGVPKGGITVHVANKAWELRSEFEDINPDTIDAFTVWSDLVIPAIPDSNITVAKRITTIIPKVSYKEATKTTTINVKTWGLAAGEPAFKLPEAPAYGAVVDLNIPAGAFEDVYGNTNVELDIVDNYLYSYGYTPADLLGTWKINGVSQSTGNAYAPDTVIIADDPDSDDENDVIIIDFAKSIINTDSIVYGVFDPVFGTLTVEDWQLLAVDWTHPTAGLTGDIFFATSESAAITFAVTSPGRITSANEPWGFYFAKGATGYGWLKRYTATSGWERISTDTTSPVPAPRFSPSKVSKQQIQLDKTPRKVIR